MVVNVIDSSGWCGIEPSADCFTAHSTAQHSTAGSHTTHDMTQRPALFDSPIPLPPPITLKLLLLLLPLPLPLSILVYSPYICPDFHTSNGAVTAFSLTVTPITVTSVNLVCRHTMIT